MQNEIRQTSIFTDYFDLHSAIEFTKDQGYYVNHDVLFSDIRERLAEEVNNLPLKYIDNVTTPINEGKLNEIKQEHENFYVSFGDERTPIANFVIKGIMDKIKSMTKTNDLRGWQLNRIGYQRYKHNMFGISPHRDSESDQKLGFTFTIDGQSDVNFYLSNEDPLDYRNLVLLEKFEATPGSLMLLRSTGFGNGERIIHEVKPPLGMRSVLNLRSQPKH